LTVVSLRRRPRLIVVGNGMAGMRTVEELLKIDPEHYDITVFGSEAHGNYNRILLSPVLAGDKKFADIMLHTREWYASNKVTLHAGDPVVKIDRHRRVVVAQSGLEASYDRLLIATGSKPFIIPVPGHKLPGVIAFRDIADVEAMLSTARTHKKAAVIGGGLLGLEAANGLMRQGMEVTVIHVMDTLMERQLDKPAANLLRRALEKRGMRFLLSAQTAEIVGNERVTGIKFKDGTEIESDLVVMAVGIRPNFELAKAAGLLCDRAIIVDDTLQTHTDPRVYAVGECVQHRGSVYGLVAPLWEQAKVCAGHLARVGYKRYPGSVTSTKLKVTGIDLYSAGDFIGGADTEDLVFRDPRRGVYKRLIVRHSDGGDRIIGAVLYGDVVDGPWYFELMQKKTDISAMRNKLLFGRSFCETPGQAA
jgi:nitrite reductase (NADH) large subunit